MSALALTILFFMSFFTVAEYERIVVTEFGKVVKIAQPGFNFKIPIVNATTTFRIDLQALKEDKVNTYTIDNQELDAHFTVNFRVPAKEVERIYREVPDYTFRLRTLAVDRFKTQVGQVNTTEIAAKRGEVANKVFNILKQDAATLLGLEVVDFQISNLDYTPTFRKAIDEAAVAKTKVDRAHAEKHQATVDAEKVKVTAIGKADAVREEARGDADALLLKAQAEAKSTELLGEAQAKAIKAQSEALAQNAKLIELRKAEKWDGKLPAQMLSSVMPMMNFEAVKGH